MMSNTPIAVERLNEFIVELTQKAGLPEEQARILADTLIEADLKGIRTHGMLTTADLCEKDGNRCGQRKRRDDRG